MVSRFAHNFSNAKMPTPKLQPYPEYNDALASLARIIQTPRMPPSNSDLTPRIARDGFCFIPASQSQTLLGNPSREQISAFAAHWDGMPLDTYMADGGRYRRRRYATLSIAAGETTATREPDQPHYQHLDYNHLNGGVARHYEPIADDVLDGPIMRALLALGATIFDPLAPGNSWHVEVHQFRIEANPTEQGQPTPEGVHRDGVDFVIVMMVKRHNIREGTTTIHGVDQQLLASFTLIEPLDMTFIDDHRCLHGVTPVEPFESLQPAYRDVLVVTFRTKPGAKFAAVQKEQP